MSFHPPPHFRYGLSPENKLREGTLKGEDPERQSKRNPRDFTRYTTEPPSKPMDTDKDPRDFTRYT